jgi:predicted aldo/keto reductase-like oxidoreductase
MMEYRNFGKSGWKLSALGFGAMRLPVLDNSAANIDEALAGRMISYAIDHGVNYLDTAYRYHERQSELCVGRILKEGGRRNKVKLATKMPANSVQSPNDFDRFLNEQLKKLQTDRIDCYLLHGLNQQSWPKVRDFGIREWAEGAIADGRILHVGFSFHDDLPTFKKIVDEYDKWALCQIQYNFMDTEYQAGTEGLKYAASRGLAVVVMEPIRGGKLTAEPSQEVKDLLTRAPRQRSLAEWALQWVWDQPEVSVALSGMSLMQHVEENVALAERSNKNHLSADELEIIDQMRRIYKRLSPIPCTKCEYCMPCPNGVSISRCFEFYNEAFMYNDPRRPRMRYKKMSETQQADKCTQCKVCVELCPQSIEIPEWLKKVSEFLGTKKS